MLVELRWLRAVGSIKDTLQCATAVAVRSGQRLLRGQWAIVSDQSSSCRSTAHSASWPYLRLIYRWKIAVARDSRLSFSQRLWDALAFRLATVIGLMPRPMSIPALICPIMLSNSSTLS